ncbi:MAG: HAMP domain-containing histidine kinase [bacterium]|nr:HAMP domain-containing histidine kinase [bacterium]
MIPNARLRLTLTYLSIIMALTLGFSAIFYNQSISEAHSNLQRQESQLRDYLYFTNPRNVQRIQSAQLRTFQNNLLNKLAILNFIMVLLGACISYLLARISLRPLEETLIQQSRFTSDAAHELRTPLTAMKTEIEVALRAKKISSAEATELLNSNLEEIAKLESLTAALLRLAKSSENIDKSHFDNFKLSDILQEAYERLADKAATRSISISLPNTKAVVLGDSDQLVELFVPLFGNAIKYSHENSEITVAVQETENKVNVEVKDVGIGIAEVDLPHIFERFYRADQSRNKTAAEGYGLGLSLAQSIAEAHGGKITAKSEYGKGSTFTVVLPKQYL